jgi:hypothetical protein
MNDDRLTCDFCGYTGTWDDFENAGLDRQDDLFCPRCQTAREVTITFTESPQADATAPRQAHLPGIE